MKPTEPDQIQRVLIGNFLQCIHPKPALDGELLPQENKETRISLSVKSYHDGKNTHSKQPKWTYLHVLVAL